MNRFVHTAILLAAALAVPSAASAQEVRCPAGFETVPTPPTGGSERVIAACLHDPMQLIVSASSVAITPASADETEVVQQLTSRVGQGGALTASPMRTEPLGGISARVTDMSGNLQMPDGTTARVEAMLALIPAGAGTLMIMGLSRDPAHAHVAPVVRALVPTITGLGSTPPAWRVSATCPSGMNAEPAEGMAPNGMRRVVRCIAQDRSQFEVLESLLPIRNPDDARAPAANMERSLGGQLRRLGGEAHADATQPYSPIPAIHGFTTAVHGTATDPRAPAGSPESTIRVEAIAAAIPTAVGHAEIVAISQNLDAAALAARLDAFVRTNLRLDGQGVPSSAPPVTDGGAAPAEVQPAPRRHEVDLSRPLWDPGEEERPHATTPPPQRSKSCGCTTPGTSTPSASTIVAALAIALGSAMRRRNGRARTH